MKRFCTAQALAALVLSAACASSGTVQSPPADLSDPPDSSAERGGQIVQSAHDDAMHEHDAHAPLPATAGPGYAVADVRFMQHMIGHHAQAVVMASMAFTHGASDHFLRLAQKIDISQRDEIAFMEQWLTERDQAVPPDDFMAHMTMPGMLEPEELAQLDAARGRAFERLFLTLMIRHHEGALQMVEELFDAPGAGQDPDIFRFATDVDADQRDEIYVMTAMLETLDNPSRSPSR